MIYQVRANFYFDIQDEAVDFLHDCLVAFLKTTVVNPTNPNEESSTYALIENHHDETPNAPCTILEQQDNSPSPP